MADIEDEAPSNTRQPLMSTGQWALFGGLLVVVIILSAALTVTLVTPSVDRDREGRNHLVDQVSALEERMAFYERELESLEQSKQELKEQQQAEQQASIPPALLDRLVDQEESLRAFIGSLQSGMQELAHMIQGSREWLELYEEQLDQVRAQSEERQQELEESQQ